MSQRNRRGGAQTKKRAREDDDDDDDDDSAEEGRMNDDDDEEEEEEVATARSASQRRPTKRKRTRRNDDDDEDDGADDEDDFGSQAVGAAKITAEEREKLVADFVRYCLFQDIKKLPIRQGDIGKAVIKEYATKGRALSKYVVEQGRLKLSSIFGLELVELAKSVIHEEEEYKGSGSFILRPEAGVKALLSAIKWRPDSKPSSSDQRVLLAIMLAVIDMHDRTTLEEKEFWNRLTDLNIDKDGSHPICGDIAVEFAQLCKQQYLVRVKGPVSDGQPTFEIGFGPRSIAEFGRVGIREMTCSIIGTSPDPTRMKALKDRDQQFGAVQEEAAPPRPAQRENPPPAAAVGARLRGPRAPVVDLVDG